MAPDFSRRSHKGKLWYDVSCKDQDIQGMTCPQKSLHLNRKIKKNVLQMQIVLQMPISNITIKLTPPE